MVDSGFELMSVMTDRMPMMVEEIIIEVLDKADEQEVISLIKRNMESFEESDSVLTATFRRLNNLHEIYGREGGRLFVAKNGRGACVACAGIGPLHGLPLSEGVGEVRLG